MVEGPLVRAAQVAVLDLVRHQLEAVDVCQRRVQAGGEQSADGVRAVVGAGALVAQRRAILLLDSVGKVRGLAAALGLAVDGRGAGRREAALVRAAGSVAAVTGRLVAVDAFLLGIATRYAGNGVPHGDGCEWFAGRWMPKKPPPPR